MSEEHPLAGAETRDVTESPRDAGIAALFLEGATFAARYYPDIGFRPTSTLHLLVRRGDDPRAMVLRAG